MSSWQDATIAVGQILFIAALVPSLLSPHKPAALTSLLTGTVLFVFAFTFFTLNLSWSAITSAICGALWFVLAMQRSRIDMSNERYWQNGAWKEPAPRSPDAVSSTPAEIAASAALSVEFNPSCKHQRTSYDIMNCEECVAYTEAKRAGLL